ncbi:methyltransferase [Kamptonema animale CS-326]|jgi:2-polyprenyl-3-methyl-5-hydroxy-6-metoxy-1,4-benzoquinol methylase|uniref:class I SAM-dependent methyltransferase n=1 Tax=Kamptonema animale TaxID=92934 RepID=UPI00232E6413|nr:methyltransferase [Kamptonema animale]MDB9512887.1 methyltransferase [Kamptonema animale CS-326]
MIKQREKSPVIENGIVVGTGSNKYQMRNPIGQLLLKHFADTIAEIVKEINPQTILEVGCGEGHITKVLVDSSDAKIHCTDISNTILNIAKDAISSPRVSFENKNIYELKSETEGSDIVVCCEVLEHLDDPILGLEKLYNVASPYCLLSVPREPIFRTLNFIRGAHFSQFGNSPGHIQHWSKRGFIKLVQTKFEIIKVKSPLPWTVILAKIK